MAQRQLPDAELQDTLALLEKCGNVSAAAREAGVPRGTFMHRLSIARSRVLTGDIEREVKPLGQPYERAWAEWQKHIGMAKERYTGPAKPRAYSGRMRVVAAGDFHIPFHDRAALAALITKEAKQTDVLVIGGDFGDAHCASTFVKYEDVSFEQEHAAKTLALEELSSAFSRVVYLKGSNHSDRFEKRLRENLTKDLIEAIQWMSGGTLNPDLALVKHYSNIEVGCHKTPNGQEIDWMCVLGDVVFTHAEAYSKVPGSVLRSLQERLDDNGKLWGLPPLRAICQFHTHSMAWLPWRSDMLLIEPGCMAQPMQYQSRAKGGGRAQRLGYVTMELVDMKLDVNSVRLVWLDADRA